MKTWDERLAAELKRQRISAELLAEMTGISADLLRKYIKGRVANPRGDQRRRIADALKISYVWLTEGIGEKDAADSKSASGLSDLVRDFTPSQTEVEPVGIRPTAKDLPVYASAEGGNGSIILDTDPIDFVLRPSPLLNVRGAYAFYLVGDSMAPAYEHGDMVLVHPGIPPRGGDDVLLIGQTDDHQMVAMVKRLVRQTKDKWHLQQFNPAKEFDAARSKWTIAHRITGKYNRS